MVTVVTSPFCENSKSLQMYCDKCCNKGFVSCENEKREKRKKQRDVKVYTQGKYISLYYFLF